MTIVNLQILIASAISAPTFTLRGYGPYFEVPFAPYEITKTDAPIWLHRNTNQGHSRHFTSKAYFQTPSPNHAYCTFCLNEAMSKNMQKNLTLL